MNIVEAIQDGNLFRSYVTNSANGDLGSWSKWLVFLRVLFGLPLSKEDRPIVHRCTGRLFTSKLSPDGYQECLLLCGRRSGKSKIIALVGAAEAILSGKEKQLSKGEIPMVAIISPTRFQSRIIFSYLKAVFQSTPMLRNEVLEERRESFLLKNKVEVAVLTGSPTAVRGFSVIAAVVDEIAAFNWSEESKVTDIELVRALRPSLASTGGRLLCVGTPFRAAGYSYDTFKRSFANDDADVLCWNAPSLFMNPTLSEKFVQRAIDEDPIAASVEYCIRPGLFREDVDSFITRAEVEALVIRDRKELAPQSSIFYSGFADVSGGKHDDASLCIAHKVDRMVILDCLERYKAPHSPYEIVARMVSTLRRYGCDKCIGDAYAAEWVRIAFQSLGIDYQRCTQSQWKTGAEAWKAVQKPKSQLYADLLPRLRSGEVELLDHDILISQLAGLQRRTRSGARDSIDHAPGSHDDCANAVAGAVDACHQRKIVAGALWTDNNSALPGGNPLTRAIAP